MESGYLTLTLLSIFSILGGIVASKAKLPPALGLLIVGAVMGPSGLGYLGSGSVIEWLIDIGAVVLLFITGLEFDINKLKTLGAKSVVAALFKIGIVFFLSYHSTIWYGFGVETALFLALILSFSSTIVIVKVLEQHHMISRKETPLLLGMLIAEDLFAIVALSFIVSIQTAGGVSFLGLVEKLLFSLFILLALYTLCIIFLPDGLKWILRNTNEEALIFIDLALCLGFALLADYLGLSSGIGAFLAGSIVASLPHAKTLQGAISPFSMIASSLFFLSMGTLVNLGAIQINIKLLGILTAIVVISRIIAVTVVTNIFANFKEEQTVFSSFAMFSVGEFSLLIARHAGGFKLDIDLISISAIIIFISSLIMAFSIKRTHEGALLIRTFLPFHLRHAHGRLQDLSEYLNRAFQEFAIESTHSNTVRSSLRRVLLTTLSIFFAFYTYQHVDSAKSLLRMAFSIFSGFLLVNLIRCLAGAFISASRMLRPIHASQDRRVGGRIIASFLFAGLLLLLGLYLPFFVFLLQLPPIANQISLALVALGGLFAWWVSRLINRAVSYPLSHPTKKMG